jgi:hypothetical protein
MYFCHPRTTSPSHLPFQRQDKRKAVGYVIRRIECVTKLLQALRWGSLGRIKIILEIFYNSQILLIKGWLYIGKLLAEPTCAIIRRFTLCDGNLLASYLHKFLTRMQFQVTYEIKLERRLQQLQYASTSNL